MSMEIKSIGWIKLSPVPTGYLVRCYDEDHSLILEAPVDPESLPEGVLMDLAKDPEGVLIFEEPLEIAIGMVAHAVWLVDTVEEARAFAESRRHEIMEEWKRKNPGLDPFEMAHDPADIPIGCVPIGVNDYGRVIYKAWYTNSSGAKFLEVMELG